MLCRNCWSASAAVVASELEDVDEEDAEDDVEDADAVEVLSVAEPVPVAAVVLPTPRDWRASMIALIKPPPGGGGGGVLVVEVVSLPLVVVD
jgi:hypothetical protein